MSPIEKRAWLSLWSMCPVYLIYFGLLIAVPDTFASMTPLQRIGSFAIVATLHAVVYLVGFAMFKYQERGQDLFADERDHAIDARASRAAYFLMLTGLIIVGVVMPFTDTGWKLVNTALFFIVCSETMRYILIVLGYRRAPQHAH
ncbi:DUF2178 domain-containing protein [Dyella sp. 2HG41-7]|uniref:DUF2178 domain-containing protein n=1 Tax=Dyella sp. 2HG41-7 TaxID=2883239 RepID=UPI001F3EA44F|nr:DUF2178 domain-containing protein [Dyella sp. 2HG41-7]